MTLRTALVITGDTGHAQLEIRALVGEVDALNASAQGAAKPAGELADAKADLGRSAKAAAGALEDLAGEQRGAAAASREAATAQGAVATSTRSSTGAVGGLYQAWIATAGGADQARVSFGAVAPAIEGTTAKAAGLVQILTQATATQVDVESSAQAAAGALVELAGGQRGVVTTSREVATAHGSLAAGARNVTGAVGGLYQAWIASADGAKLVRASLGAVAPAIAGTTTKTDGLVQSLTQAALSEQTVQAGSEKLAATLAGALAGGLATVAAGAVAVVVQLGAEAYAAYEASTASAQLASALADLDKAQKDVASSASQEAARHLQAAEAKTADAIETRKLIQANLELARTRARNKANFGPETRMGGTIFAGGKAEVDQLEKDIAKQDKVIETLRKVERVRSIPLLQGFATADIDKARAATDKFDRSVSQLNQRFRTGQIAPAAYRAEYARLTQEKDAAVAAAGRVAAATGRAGRAHAAGAASTREEAAAAGALAAAQRELASDLAGVIGRYDPARKAAADYAAELERIARLEAAGETKGGLSKADADRYRAAAEAALIKARADAFVLPDVAAAGAAAAAIDDIEAALRGEIAALMTLDPIQREMLRYRQQLAAMAPEERAAAEDRLRGLLGERIAIEDVNAAAREAADANRQLLDAARGALDAIVVGGQRAGDVVDRLARSLASAALEAAVFGTGPLAGLLSGAAGGGRRPSVAAGATVQADVVNKAVEKGTSSALDRVFGTKGSFKTTLRNAGYGSMAASLTGGSATAGLLGGALGGKAAETVLGKALGSWAGPIGSVLGGAVFGALGGVLKKTKSGAATIGGGDGPVLSGNSASYRKSAGAMAGSVDDILGQIAGRLGGSVGTYGSITIGQRDGDYRVNLGGTSLKKKKGAADFGEDQGAAIMYAAQAAIARGAVIGLSDRVAQALRSSPDLDKAVAEGLKVQELEVLLGGVSGALEKAFSDFDAVAQERVRIARQYGFDVIAIEKRNAEDRAKIAADLAKGQIGPLQQLLDEMERGSLFAGNAIERIDALNTAITKARADTDAGVEGAGDLLARLLQDRLGAMQDAYGTTGGYAAGRADTVDQARAAIAAANARITAAQAQSDPALKETNKALADSLDQGDAMLDHLRSIDLAIGGWGGGGGGSYFDLARMAQV